MCRKRIFFAVFLCLGLSGALFGCSKNTAAEGEKEGNGGHMEETLPVRTMEETSSVTPSIEAGIVWKDNGSDSYIGIRKVTIAEKEPEGLIGSSGNTLLNAEGGGLFRKYFFENYKENYESLFWVDEAGEQTEIMPETADYDASGMVTVAGTIAGSGGYVYSTVAGVEVPEQWVIFTDADRKLTGKYKLPEDLEFLESIMGDANGNLYCTMQDKEGLLCQVYDKEGLLIWETSYPAYDFLHLTALADGKVAFFTGERTEGYYLLLPDLESGKEKILAKADNKVTYLTCFDEKTLLYADAEGLYRSSPGFDNAELVYNWVNHGIQISEIKHMLALPNGDIKLLFTSEGETVYLHLSANNKENSIEEISFAVLPENEQVYREAVTAFNKEYPGYVITMVTYEEPAKLLTELTAGDGPVLVDTALVPFLDNESLWECLDEELAQSGLTEELLEKPMQAGKINERQYGIVSKWQMLTFATTVYSESSWDYDTFFEWLTNHPKVQMLYGEQSPSNFMNLFFMRSLQDNYFINMDEKKAYFDMEQFEEAVLLAGRLAAKRPSGTQSEQILRVREGSCLGEPVYLLQPESIAYYDAMFGEKVNYIGFPGADGSCHYIRTANPLVIRATAAPEQKEGAFLFLQGLLEYEEQKKLVEGTEFSMRRDVFEEQLAGLDDEIEYSVDGEQLSIPVDAKTVREKVLALYENSVPYLSLPESIGALLEEELESCFSGQKSAGEAGKVIQNRIQLYLDN